MLKLNDDKNEMAIFTSKHHINLYGVCSMTIGSDIISPVDRVRNVGVHMDEYLTMPHNVTAACVACNCHLFRLSSCDLSPRLLQFALG